MSFAKFLGNGVSQTGVAPFICYRRGEYNSVRWNFFEGQCYGMIQNDSGAVGLSRGVEREAVVVVVVCGWLSLV